MTTGILVLAAGRARRFGSDKRVAQLPGGEKVLAKTLREIRASGLPYLVCLDEGDTSLSQTLWSEGHSVLGCQCAGQGMGATLAEGVRSITDRWDAVLVTLGDMPWIKGETYSTVAATVTPETICQPVFGDRSGHPVAFGLRFYPELSALGGDNGARGVLQQHPESVVMLPVRDGGIVRDVDVPEDLSG